LNSFHPRPSRLFKLESELKQRRALRRSETQRKTSKEIKEIKEIQEIKEIKD